MTPHDEALVEAMARAKLAPECCAEFGTEPDCACPHEHWHIGAAGCCLDVHVEDEGYTHATLDMGDCGHEVELHGLSTMDQARPVAFAWAFAIIDGPNPLIAAERARVERETLERAARSALDPCFIRARGDEWDTGFNDAKRLIAAAIRALPLKYGD